MLTRKRYREVPPRVDYELTDRARELMPILGELARWGYEWAWSSPREQERVDLGAIFRLAPGLVHTSRSTRGRVEFIVSARELGGGAASYVLAASGGGVTIEEHPEPDAEARVEGTVDGWVHAFSPEGDRGELSISGDTKLATEMLDGLALVEHRAVSTSGAGSGASGAASAAA